MEKAGSLVSRNRAGSNIEKYSIYVLTSIFLKLVQVNQNHYGIPLSLWKEQIDNTLTIMI